MNDDYCYKAFIAKLLLLVANRGKVDDYRNGTVKDQGHNFFKLFWANFPKFLGSGYFASQGKIVFFFIKTNCFAKQVGLCFENY